MPTGQFRIEGRPNKFSVKIQTQPMAYSNSNMNLNLPPAPWILSKFINFEFTWPGVHRQRQRDRGKKWGWLACACAMHHAWVAWVQSGPAGVAPLGWATTLSLGGEHSKFEWDSNPRSHQHSNSNWMFEFSTTDFFWQRQRPELMKYSF